MSPLLQPLQETRLSLLVARTPPAALSFLTLFSNGGALSVVDIYDVNMNLWNSTSTGAGSLSVARALLGAAAAGTKIVFAGGLYVIYPTATKLSAHFSDTIGTTLATVDIYDVTTGIWTSTGTGAGSLSVARYYLAAAAAGTKVVFAGGA